MVIHDVQEISPESAVEGNRCDMGTEKVLAV